MKERHLNNKKVIKYANNLISKINSSKCINKELHEDIINFCIIVLADNPRLFKKINVDTPEIISVKLKNYSRKKGKYSKPITFQDTGVDELIENTKNILKRIVKIYSLENILVAKKP